MLTKTVSISLDNAIFKGNMRLIHAILKLKSNSVPKGDGISRPKYFRKPVFSYRETNAK